MAREGVPLNVIQRQLGHANLGITSVYWGDNAEIIDTVHARRAPMIRQYWPAPILVTAATIRLAKPLEIELTAAARVRCALDRAHQIVLARLGEVTVPFA